MSEGQPTDSVEDMFGELTADILVEEQHAKILEERALKKPRETKEKKTRFQATQLSLMWGEYKDKVDDALTWVPRGDIQSDPVSTKKCSLCALLCSLLCALRVVFFVHS